MSNSLDYLQKMTENLSNSAFPMNDYLRNLLDHLPFGILVFNGTEQPVYSSPVAKRILGKSVAKFRRRLDEFEGESSLTFGHRDLKCFNFKSHSENGHAMTTLAIFNEVEKLKNE